MNPLFTDHNAACIVVEEDHNFFMLLTREYFQSITPDSMTMDLRTAFRPAVAAGLPPPPTRRASGTRDCSCG